MLDNRERNKKSGVIEEKIEIRKFLVVTVLFHHDIVDRAPTT